MTNGKTVTVTEKLNSEEDFDALQEVTAELEQAEARIRELEAKLSKAVWRLEEMRDDDTGYRNVVHFRRGAAVTLAELKGKE